MLEVHVQVAARGCCAGSKLLDVLVLVAARGCCAGRRRLLDVLVLDAARCTRNTALRQGAGQPCKRIKSVSTGGFDTAPRCKSKHASELKHKHSGSHRNAPGCKVTERILPCKRQTSL
eukprot:4517740-Amphidinium_carterae.1